MTDLRITCLEAFDRNGLFVGHARQMTDFTGRWAVRVRRSLTVVGSEQDARNMLAGHGGMTIRESDGLKR